jgi:hypothetical protein
VGSANHLDFIKTMTSDLLVFSAAVKINSRSATWDDYLAQLANPELEDCRVFFNSGFL